MKLLHLCFQNKQDDFFSNYVAFSQYLNFILPVLFQKLVNGILNIVCTFLTFTMHTLVLYFFAVHMVRNQPTTFWNSDSGKY
jgi:hypothetical protein